MNLIGLVDSMATDRIIVFGSPPPAGRDLDLLVRRQDEAAVAGRLGAGDFVRVGRRWARFRDCSVDVVELVPVREWGLPEPEVADLFARSQPLDGARHLAAPSPQHVLLILARRLASGGGGLLDDRRRGRIEAAVGADPRAFAQARTRAKRWGVRLALDALEQAYRRGRPPGRITVARASAELLAATDGRGRRGSWLGLGSVLPGRPRRGSVVAFSGLDGSGKSSQAEALRVTLERLGFNAVVEWSSLAFHSPALHAIARAGKSLLRPAAPTEDAGKALRQRSGFINLAWASLVAFSGALAQSRAVHRHLWRGRVVICDRYTLDSKVQLRHAYGPGSRFRLQTMIIRALSPKPQLAYFLDVSPRIATDRKRDYELKENELRAKLYREDYADLGARRLDGERPREETCARVAADVLKLLSGERHTRGQIG